MFDDHYETYWHGYDPVEVQNRVEIVFHNPIKFMKMILVARPSRVKDMKRYQNLCFYLDDVKRGCTSSYGQTEGAKNSCSETEGAKNSCSEPEPSKLYQKLKCDLEITEKLYP